MCVTSIGFSGRTHISSIWISNMYLDFNLKKHSSVKTLPSLLYWWIFAGFLWPRTYGASNLPLLSGTLRTFQVHACDGDELKIECWPDTVINIYLAQYGRQVPSYQLCPQEGVTDISRTIVNETTNCVASEALRTVEQACREQQICRVRASPHTFATDPCPGVRKYAEVAYKCRPKTFFNKFVCEGDRLRLNCHKNFRIAIYSAAFGATHYGVPECPQPNGEGKIEDCQVSYATEGVMSNCHGRRKCSIGADVGTFGSPGCPTGTRLFLKVVHTCVPREILKDLDLGGNEDAESDYKDFIEMPPHQPSMTTDHPVDLGASVYKMIPTLKTQPAEDDAKRLMDLGGQTTVKTDMQSDENSGEEGEAKAHNIDGEQRVIGFLTEWLSAYNFIRDNKEKFILYLSLGLSVALLTVLGLLTTKMYIRRSRLRRERVVKPPIPISTSPSELGGISPFGDDCTDLDHFDNPARHQDSGVEVVRYATRSSLKRAIPLDEEETSLPRAPVRAHTNYYYS